jgi:hypothetical protein
MKLIDLEQMRTAQSSFAHALRLSGFFISLPAFLIFLFDQSIHGRPLTIRIVLGAAGLIALGGLVMALVVWAMCEPIRRAKFGGQRGK